MSTSIPIPIYVLHANTLQEESHLHNQLHADVEGPIAQKPTTSTAIQTARDAIAHAAGLDTEQWCTRYVIVVDRPATDVLDYGVLVVNMDFRGRVDGTYHLHPLFCCVYIRLANNNIKKRTENAPLASSK